MHKPQRQSSIGKRESLHGVYRRSGSIASKSTPLLRNRPSTRQPLSSGKQFHQQCPSSVISDFAVNFLKQSFSDYMFSRLESLNTLLSVFAPDTGWLLEKCQKTKKKNSKKNIKKRKNKKQ